jgi:hypothetical protein
MKIEWPDHPKVPVNLHTVIPGWFIHFTDAEKIKMYYLQQDYIFEGKQLTPDMGLLHLPEGFPIAGFTTAHSFINKLTEGR